jgi:hypothetical protein
MVNASCYLETKGHVVASILDIQMVGFEEKYLGYMYLRVE